MAAQPRDTGDGNNFGPEQRTLTVTRDGRRQCQPADLDTRAKGRPNSVRTTRFTLVSWLPKSLFVQFQRSANVYFLVVSVLVLLDFSPIMWSSTVFAFCIFLLWTALKDMYEDMRRRRDDDAENLRGTFRYDFDKAQFAEVKWCDVLCGDILLTYQDEAIPADVLLLHACGGQAFISTVNLDGETNLKERRSAEALSAVTEATSTEARDQKQANEVASRTVVALLGLGLEVELEQPKASLSEMNGLLRLKTPPAASLERLTELKVEMPFRLNFEHFVPRGTVLRNIPYVISMAAYVGDDTKTRLNCASTQAKISNMQAYLNRGVQGLITTLVVFCLYVAIRAEVEGVASPEGANWPETDSAITLAIVRMISYFIILYQIVPISLYVCFEVVKLLLGWQINMDPQMVDPRTGKPALARTADLVEEMGQVNFVFSDKTGTLTENEMVFASCCIQGRDMGDFRPAVDLPATPKAKAGLLARGASGLSLGRSTSGDSDTKIPQVKKEVSQGPDHERMKMMLADLAHPESSEARTFFLCMASCHSAQVDYDTAKTAKFSGSSPDEVAFLEAAHSVGVSYTSRRRLPGKSGWELRIQYPGSEQESDVFEVLCEVPFTSDRKRMTVVVRHNGKLYCVVKGADNIMQPFLKAEMSKADHDCNAQYAMKGLRTLVFARKLLEESFFEDWNKRMVAAESMREAEGRDERIATVVKELEHSLDLVGISAIEDKLQYGVPEAVASIKAASIRFWVLTGDKTETAVEIVRACRLFTEDMTLASLVDCKSTDQARELLQAAREKLQGCPNGGLIVDGTFTSYMLLEEDLCKLMYELAMNSTACVCCRLSPEQKRKLVEVVRRFNKLGITLAIGDGANDVSMIQGAHVGIGIRGKEGNQAVQASDVAISQFRFLVPLLFCHGRRAYRRVSVILCFVLYKHIVLATGDFIWAHQCSLKFSGQIAYPEWLSSAFPLFITGLPVIVSTCTDIDLPDEISVRVPEIYKEGIDRLHFNPWVFTTWMLTAIYHGSIAWLVPNMWVGTGSSEVMVQVGNEWQQVPDTEFWRASACSFILVIIFINVRLWMCAFTPWAAPTAMIILFSFFSLFVTMLVLGGTAMGEAMQPELMASGVPAEVFTGKYIKVMVITSLVLVLDVTVMLVWQQFKPTPVIKARRRWRQGEFQDAAPALKDAAQSGKNDVQADKIKDPTEASV